MSDNETLKNIENLVKEHKVVLFMKGTPQFPQCGFSQRVASILAELKVEYAHVNVLLDPSVREGIKVYSDWPTIPQLYVGSEFVGGCDIVSELYQSGELAELVS